MKIWIVNPYGTLPSEGWREYRSFLLAKALAKRGHEVTCWISDFEHRSKSYRTSGELHDPLLPGGVRVIAVHSSAYRHNISLNRIFYEINFGKNWALAAENQSTPDVIVLGDPALFFGSPVAKYAKCHEKKLVLDVIDLWPELFTVALPKFLQPLGNVIFHPMFRKRNKLANSCNALVAVSQDYLNVINRSVQSKLPSMVAYLGIDVYQQRSQPINVSLSEKLISFKNSFSMLVVYAGTLGDAYDMNLLLEAVRRTNAQGLSICFVVAGDGPRKMDLIAAANQYSTNLLFLGQLPSEDLTTLYAAADVGLMTYVPGSTVAMPVKFFDYLTGGLAIISSLGRDVAECIEKYKVGMTYKAANVDDLMNRLVFLERHPLELAKIKTNSHSLADAYDSALQYEKYSDFLERLVLHHD